MKNRIAVYNDNAGNLIIVNISKEAVSSIGFDSAVKLTVPNGLRYSIIEKSDLPIDGSISDWYVNSEDFDMVNE